MRSMLKGELSEIEDKLKKVEQDADNAMHQGAQNHSQIETVNEQFTELRSTLNMMTATLGELETKAGNQ